MSGLKDYYELDFLKTAIVKYELSAAPKSGGISAHKFQAQAHIDFTSHVKFCSFYIPEELCGQLFEICKAALAYTKDILALRGAIELKLPKVDGSWTGQAIDITANEYMDIDISLLEGGRYSVTNFIAARPVYIYAESDLSPEEESKITSLGSRYSCEVILRGRNYSMERLLKDTPVAFISHDSNDKASIARPIAEGLTKMGLSVWFDEYSLKPGDRLRESIEKGMKDCKKCILILTPNFLKNMGWTAAEFNMIFTREIIEEQSLVIPVWAGVNKKEVYEYSPGLLNVLGAIWPEDASKQEKTIIDIASSLDV
ncbi:toll/interleukin-1 receptor domain-containing protein [Aeromonas hydrophila]|uniref:toll/interleukin-1 receptor domain-containing protein n=1 Tax=Aeromonas hydrophila TaxID=644 RepID=UPI0009B8EB6F|nr:toll/interleukin-1 receptor domain-containing protein [Aeromonas hydrophila]